MRSGRGLLVTAATACLLAATSAPATAQDDGSRTVTVGAQSLYAPSDLVLAYGPGADVASATVSHSVTLSCAPRPAGTHPDASAACAELAAVQGEFGELSRPDSAALCTKEWAPVTVSATGVWEGRRVDWSATYANACAMEAELAQSAALAF
ncbi:SSI family serine proteinase inhibitor [Streptomyces sp. Da 82-17]|uniref:SSI family serine proteinase inhibitor n=1 Tax=Streptomyces sp. Da 82-17 TaxID=3377116 RepID=UPI0038D36DB6